MNSYDNTNSGALFTNNKKSKDSDPLYRGSVDVEGIEYWVSSWVNISKAGEKYMSLKLTKKEDSQSKQSPQSNYNPSMDQQQASQGFDDMNSEIPF